VEETLWGHLTLLKFSFCFENLIGLMIHQMKVLVLIDENKLDFKPSFLESQCKTTMLLLQNYHYCAP
jgi:hypothetical protein